MAPSNSTAQKPLPVSVSVRKRTEAPRGICSPLTLPPSKKYKSLKEIMKIAERSFIDRDYFDLRCEECESGDQADEMLLCDKCDKGFHMYCLRPIVVRIPIGSWFCPSCSRDRLLRSFPLKQKKIVDFFRIQKFLDVKESGASPQDAIKRRRRSGSIVVYKKKRRLLPFTPTDTPARRLEQMGSLATALMALQIEFSNDLTYMSDMAPSSANQARFEKGGMQVLSKEDVETLEHCRAMCRRGEWPPLLVVFDSCEGFTVEADCQIKDMTLITEYTGDVDYMKNRENDDCDSMMTLLSTENPAHSLVICPDKRGNIARFISGINNHTQEGRKKQNLKCVRYNVNGECRVLLVAIRDIAKGERLYYDYNGYVHEYPTHHFV